VASTGYSGTPLARKLGIRSGDRVAVVDDPGHLRALLEPLPAGATVGGDPDGADVVVCFVRRRHDLAGRLEALGTAIFPDRSCWIAWPKRSSGVETDVTEDVVRELALPLGLVDTKVCAVDETWSGLKLVWRKERRGN
jgi:hypothetical protein